MAFPYELAELIYKDLEVGFIIYALAPIVPFMYLETVVTGILQGLNQQMHSLKYNIFDSVIRISLIYLLVPQKGLNAFILIMILSNITTSSLNIYRTLKITNTKIQWLKWIILPSTAVFISIIAMTLLLKNLMLPSLYYVVIGAVIISITYFAILFVTKALKLKDLSLSISN